MTPDAKRALSSTIRGLRARLIADLDAAAESAWRLSVRAQDAELSEAERARRARIEDHLAEQARADASGGGGKKGQGRTLAAHRSALITSAAYTWLNRVVVLRLLEAADLRGPAVVTGGWDSPAYRQFRAIAPALVQDDPTEGYATLLRLVFEDLAGELPGIFGGAGLVEAVPMPAHALRDLVQSLDDPALASCWTDEMTLGWVYQYFNDPAREAIDAKLNQRGKVEPHEIASKTQLFTERYMVDWLLQNTLGPLWLAMCEKHGWTPEVVGDGTLETLEARRADWRARREAGEVEPTALMPLHTDRERRWAYTVRQPLPQTAVGATVDATVEAAPDTIRDLKLLDPAVGSGHFLVVAADLLFALYQEEARHRGETDQPQWSDGAIVERILSHNLHGIDLDPRAVQIAAAALWLTARRLAPDARPTALNLVASDLRLAHLPDDDPTLTSLRAELARETGIPGELTDTLIGALRGADHLGSLLRIDAAVEAALDAHDEELGRAVQDQGDLFAGYSERRRERIDRATAMHTVLGRLERFLEHHSRGDDLGLRLWGAQLARGVRFVRLVREGSYDVVIGNPPYQGTARMADASYIQKNYPRGKADLYAAFLERGLQLTRPGGLSAMLTMRGWMFIKQYAALRMWLLETWDLRGLLDLSSGAFEEINPAQVVVSVVGSVFRKAEPGGGESIAIKAFDEATVTQQGETDRKRAAVLAGVGRVAFRPAALKVIPEWPLVYWWDEEMIDLYQSAPLIGEVAPARAAQSTGDNSWFVRNVWEMRAVWDEAPALSYATVDWFPFINGGQGREWIEPALQVVNWANNGFPVKISKCHKTGVSTCSLASEEYFLEGRGVAFSTVGSSFSARVHRYPSIFGDMGSSVFPEDLAGAVCAMNSRRAREILESLNPSIRFQAGDVNRLPLFPVPDAERIFATVESAFALHEAHREPSVEFRQPGPSPWRHAQEWAQLAVDRRAGEPVPPYEAVFDPEAASDHISFGLGVALGRFRAVGDDPSAGGILDPSRDDLSHALPHGVLLLDGTLPSGDLRDDLGHPAAEGLRQAWEAQRGGLDTKRKSLRDYLRLDFFAVHRSMYDNRPIHWPLSSAGRTFVVWVNIHRMSDRTLVEILARLQAVSGRLDGWVADLRGARDGGEAGAAREAERRLPQVSRWRGELAEFVAALEEAAERGAPQSDLKAGKCPPRERDARYAPQLDDGVMINSAGLWPLLQPQWKDPKKWWTELARERKDYDWSQLAMRYWPTRVDQKCQQDPSFAVAHGCFWRYHPAKAWAWELRLQEEIGPEFRIEEGPYTHPDGRHSPDHEALRAEYLAGHPDEALDAVEKEALRRMGRGKDRRIIDGLTLRAPGLRAAHPARCEAIEDRLSERQGARFRLRGLGS